MNTLYDHIGRVSYFFSVFVKHHYSGLSFFGKIISRSICSIFLLCMKSNGSEKLTNNCVTLRSFARTPSLIWRIVRICGVVSRLLRKTFWRIFSKGATSTLNSKTLKLVDEFTYVGNNISSTESNVNIGIGKAWTAIDKLSIIWKSDITDNIKRDFSKQWHCWYYCMDAPSGL